MGRIRYHGISGRSIGDINVQVILEQLGGGGSMTIAGAQITDIPVEETKEKLMQSIKNCLNQENT